MLKLFRTTLPDLNLLLRNKEKINILMRIRGVSMGTVLHIRYLGTYLHYLT